MTQYKLNIGMSSHNLSAMRALRLCQMLLPLRSTPPGGHGLDLCVYQNALLSFQLLPPQPLVRVAPTTRKKSSSITRNGPINAPKSFEFLIEWIR